MGKRDPRVDTYIAKSADFACPVLPHIRQLVHAACPDVEETLKWGFPHFIYHGILCSMASFKQHCAFGFWHRAMQEPLGASAQCDAMGQFGRYVKQAMKLNSSGSKPPRVPKAKSKPKLSIPADFAAALKKNKKTLATMERFSDSQQREYVEWITEAKREETRAKRLAIAVEWRAEGKPRNWKYIKK